MKRKLNEDATIKDAFSMLDKAYNTAQDIVEKPETETSIKETLQTVVSNLGTAIDVMKDKLEVTESVKIEEATGTDYAVEAISDFIKNDELDIEYLNSAIQLQIDNDEKIYNEMVTTRAKDHSIAYMALIKEINGRSEVELTGRQVQAGFKKLGIDFKEAIAPSVEYVKEQREELKEEESFLKAPEKVYKDSEEKGLYTETVNPECEDMYQDTFCVNVCPAIPDVETKEYNVFANSEPQALQLLCVHLEDSCPEYLFNCNDVDPESTELVYVDGTEYGATQPYFLNIKESRKC